MRRIKTADGYILVGKFYEKFGVFYHVYYGLKYGYPLCCVLEFSLFRGFFPDHSSRMKFGSDIPGGNTTRKLCFWCGRNVARR